MTEAILETEGLTKRFGNFTAVDDVDLSVARGERRGLIGPNGAGKTTFQNLITGQYDATEGQIYFDGDDITDLEPFERARAGIIRKFQVTRVYESETLLENLRLALRGRQLSTWGLLRSRDDSDIDDRAVELLEVANLADRRDETAANLSHGESQWLEIVMAVGASPDFLLLDEPTSGMSGRETTATAELIRDIREQEDLTIMVVEHDMEFIREVSDRLTVLHRGEIIAEGTVDEVEADERVQEVYLGRD
jgi:urea ABC transporter ATP-binding protein UrtD